MFKQCIKTMCKKKYGYLQKMYILHVYDFFYLICGFDILLDKMWKNV